ncbi:MAG: hypothetical protein WD359_02260 [Dehalococcoidia bacterium]
MTLERRSQIAALLAAARNDLRPIEAKYRSSLSSQGIDYDLQIAIKNLLENLRSALDYVAHEIRDVHCPAANKNARLYFPICPSKSSFAADLPDLEVNRPAIVGYLASIQPYGEPKWQWLEAFVLLTNENKHHHLVPQTRTERVRVKATRSGAGEVSWDPSSVRFGSGVSILGSPVDPSSQLPAPSPGLEVVHTVWVDFHFDGVPGSALGLLRQFVDGVDEILAGVVTRL